MTNLREHDGRTTGDPRGPLPVAFPTKPTAPEKPRAKEVIDRELRRLAAANGGKLTPEVLVKAARPKRHPLHGFFEWDDGIAAERWRLDQAQRMISAAKYLVQEVEARARPPAIGRVRTWLPEGRRTCEFRERAAVLSEADQRAAWIDERITALRAWCGTVIDVKELTAIRLGVESLLDEYEGK